MEFGSGIGQGKSTSGPDGSQYAPMPKKYNPSLVNPSIERMNRLYGYSIAIPNTDPAQPTELGIGSLGLLIQFFALSALSIFPIWMAFAEQLHFELFGLHITYNIVFIVCMVVSFALLLAGFVVSRPYVRRHTGANLACGLFTHIAPVHIVAGLLFIPLTLLGAM